MNCGTKSIPNGDICLEAEIGTICNSFSCNPGFLSMGSFKCGWDFVVGAAVWTGDAQCKRACTALALPIFLKFEMEMRQFKQF